MSNMDAKEFEALARRPTLSRGDLENLKQNALAKGNRFFATIADEILNERFPSVKRRTGGATPTTAMFLHREQDFPNGKEAYIWLVQRFREHRSGLLENQEQWHHRAFKGASRRYFSDSPESLFPIESNQSSLPSNFSELPGGWYANVNLSHRQKFDILLRLGAVCNLEYLKQWDFRVVGASLALGEKQRITALGQALLEELSNW